MEMLKTMTRSKAHKKANNHLKFLNCEAQLEALINEYKQNNSGEVSPIKAENVCLI